MVGHRAIKQIRDLVAAVCVRVVAVEEVHARGRRDQHRVAGHDVVAHGRGSDRQGDSRDQPPRQHESARQVRVLRDQRKEQDQCRWAIEQHVRAGQRRHADQQTQAEPARGLRRIQGAHAAPDHQQIQRQQDVYDQQTAFVKDEHPVKRRDRAGDQPRASAEQLARDPPHQQTHDGSHDTVQEAR